jgi:hypothetical protein
MPLSRCADKQPIPWFGPVSDHQAEQSVDVRRVAAKHSSSKICLVVLESLKNPEQ